MEIDPIQQLTGLALSEHQARTYWARLSCQPATAYEIAKEAQIPTTTIYQLIHELQDLGIIIPTDDGDKQSRRYLALDPEIFLERAREQVIVQTKKLSPILSSQIPAAQAEFVWPLNSRIQMLQTTEAIITRTKRVLLVSTDRHELNELSQLLTKIQGRRVKLVVLCHGEQCQIKASRFYWLPKFNQGQASDRCLHIVADNKQALTATLTLHGRVQGCWSRQLAMVNLVDNQIRQQILIAKLLTQMGPAIQKQFGRDYKKLLDIFLD